MYALILSIGSKLKELYLFYLTLIRQKTEIISLILRDAAETG